VKAKKKAEIAVIARQAARDLLADPGAPFHVLSVRFADGQGIDIPYQPWKPRQTLDIPGKWVRDDA
jgi:hypothetical protein